MGVRWAGGKQLSWNWLHYNIPTGCQSEYSRDNYLTTLVCKCKLLLSLLLLEFSITLNKHWMKQDCYFFSLLFYSRVFRLNDEFHLEPKSHIKDDTYEINVKLISAYFLF
jgi:hypothetical protein